ncbi:hypothetical protein B0H13DRAFT_2086763 [Mycena leptocephala]|nr:hypothetical protein B0H13DRAFT_2086763 [Mycena leptocephala]
MSLPPVPPRPPTVVAPQNTTNNNYESPPHFDNPLVAPRPHRVDPQIGANMARDLDNSMNQQQQAQLNPGSGSAFLLQPGAARTPSPLPPPQGADWSPWAPAAHQQHQQQAARTPSPMPPRASPPHRATAPSPSLSPPSPPSPPPSPPSPPLPRPRPPARLDPRRPLPRRPHPRACLVPSSAGCGPVSADAGAREAAFRDFEAAARAGHAPAWFRLARDYEAFNDTPHALDCLNRGAKARDPAALHRLGVAHLLGEVRLSLLLLLPLPSFYSTFDFLLLLLLRFRLRLRAPFHANTRRIPSRGYFRAVKSVCNKFGALLVLGEPILS